MGISIMSGIIIGIVITIALLLMGIFEINGTQFLIKELNNKTILEINYVFNQQIEVSNESIINISDINITGGNGS